MEQQRVKKIVVASLFVLFGIAVFYIIFSPSKDDVNQVRGQGINTEMPDPEEDILPENKLKVYSDADLASGKKNRNIERLGDFLEQERENRPPRPAKEDYIGKLLDATKDSRETGSTEQARQNYETELRNRQIEEKLASYEAQFKQMEQTNNQLTSVEKMTREMTEANRATNLPVKKDTVVIRDFVEAKTELDETVGMMGHTRRNNGFNTAVGSSYDMGRNTVEACIHKDQTVTDGQRVMLRLMEPLQVGSLRIPRYSPIAGVAKINGDRMDIRITTIEYEGNILPVDMAVFDSDGLSGLFVPGSEELNQVKETAADIGQSIGSGTTITESVKDQIVGDAVKGVIKGTANLFSKKVRTVKVDLKENYRVLLMPKKKER